MCNSRKSRIKSQLISLYGNTIDKIANFFQHNPNIVYDFCILIQSFTAVSYKAAAFISFIFATIPFLTPTMSQPHCGTVIQRFLYSNHPLDGSMDNFHSCICFFVIQWMKTSKVFMNLKIFIDRSKTNY